MRDTDKPIEPGGFEPFVNLEAHAIGAPYHWLTGPGMHRSPTLGEVLQCCYSDPHRIDENDIMQTLRDAENTAADIMR